MLSSPSFRVLFVLLLCFVAVGSGVQVAGQDPDPSSSSPNTTMSADIPQTWSLPPLGYSYDALEPFWDSRTMELHHSAHHKAYVSNSVSILKSLSPKDAHLQRLSPEELITRLHEVPEDKRTGLRNNAGGHVNHSMFWKGLKKGTKLGGNLRSAIESNFGSVDEFKSQFEKAAAGRFGSGWAWLVGKDDGSLAVVDTANQDSPLMGEEIAGCSGYPIIGLDVWEHAYYLKFQNRRPDYIKTFWSVINWDEASKRYDEWKNKVGRRSRL